MFANSFKENWDRPALTNYKQDTITYCELATKIARIHIMFEKIGVKKGDNIALCSKNCVNWAVAYLATLTYGAVVVPILPDFKASNIHHLINHCEAKVFFVGSQIWDSISPTEMPKLQVIVSLTDMHTISAEDEIAFKSEAGMNTLFDEKYPQGFGPKDIKYHDDKPSELALISYTSGTSGFSKGVMLPYRSLWSNVCFAGYAEPQMNNNSKMLAILPSAHMYGMIFEFLFEMTIGAHVYFLTRLPSPKVITSAMNDVKPDVVIAVPLIIEKIYKYNLLPFISKGRIRMLLNLPLLDSIVKKKIKDELVNSFGGVFKETIIGGAAFNREAEAFFKRIEFPYTIGYGMTECGPIITYVPWDQTRLFSCGKVAPRMKIKIDSPKPKEIPGEIMVRGDNVFLGYYKDKKATEAAFDDGWFRTGDMGIMDKDGYLYIKGRCKNMILGPSGQNINPEEIESIINNIQYVSESLVIEDDGLLTALIFPDFSMVEDDNLTETELEKRLDEEIKMVNLELPHFSKISKFELMPEEFEKTPKRSIKRYLYQRNK